ncbi:zinc finger protein 385D isoform X1 [Chelmon rostratus]|uniref:zinc finger protein 385D isoform X1 n=1 Tax=Chelmon rostratus TaxID=109905 RepID=UPI001BEBA86D|nr:zinc finger protein 385D isoform X1 [Chelmon rostratus]
MESSMFFGNTCQNGLMPALVRPTLPAVQTSLGMKQFLPFPLDTASAVRLFPGFNTMDPVQKAVLHHTLGLPPTAKRKHVSCSVCQLRFNSQSQAMAHYKGTKHAKKLKALDAPKSKLKGSAVTKETANQDIAKGINTSQVPNGADRKDVVPGASPLPLSPVLRLAQPLASLMTLTPPTPPPVASPSTTAATAPETTSAAGGDERPSELSSPTQTPDLEPEAEPETENDAETEEEKARRLLYCSLCKVAVNSASQLEAHNSGTKHKTMLEARTGVGSIKSFPRPGVKSKLATSAKSATGLQNKTFYCETCDVHVNSETQLKQHISSRRHKDRAADQVVPGEGASVSASDGTDHTCSPGGSGSRHRQLFHTPHEPRHQPRPDPRPLPDTDPPRCTAPPGPWACQDLPPTSPICPLLTSCQEPNRALQPRPGRGVVCAPLMHPRP